MRFVGYGRQILGYVAKHVRVMEGFGGTLVRSWDSADLVEMVERVSWVFVIIEY